MAFYEHAEEFAGKPVVDFQSGQTLDRSGNTAYAIRVEYDSETSGIELLTELLQDPNADRLEALVIGAWSGELYEDDSSAIVELLVSAAPKLASLKALFLGDITMEENEISWIKQSDVSPIWAAFPRLEVFRTRGSQDLSLGKITHDHLKSLIVECGGLPAEVLQSVAAAKLPSLEHLELYLGTDDYGWTGTIDDVRALLKPGLFPKLKYLGLRDSEIADEAAKAVVESGILPKIEVLDLSLGTLGDEGAAALLRSDDVRKLKKLDLHHHYMSEEMMQRLEALPIEVDASDRQQEEEYGRFVSVGE